MNTYLKKIKCLNCHEPFQPRHSVQIYCSEVCDREKRQKDRDIIILEGKSSSKQCKRYLLRKYGNKCMNPDCGWDNDKKPVNVELEHIDGDSSNNNLSNLTLLCPNCHSCTPTYKSKNKGKGRFIKNQ